MGTPLPLPALTATGTLRYRLELNAETPSNNELREIHYRAYKTLRSHFKLRVLKALGAKRPSAPIERSFLIVRRHCAGLLDWDNAAGGLKPVLDCLVMPTRKNPDGLGLVRDDSPRSMPFMPYIEQHKAPKKKGYTEILIYELDETPTTPADEVAA